MWWPVAPWTQVYRSYLKIAFWPPAYGWIGASFKILEILEYACGLRPTIEDKTDGESGFA
jgi:hypothetical protein